MIQKGKEFEKKNSKIKKAQGKEGQSSHENFINDAAALAETLAEKVRKKKEQDERAARAAESQAHAKVERKKKSENDTAGLDDLLNAGLSGVKKK